MKESLVKTVQGREPFVKIMATIVFETNVRHKGRTKAAINIPAFGLSEEDLCVYTSLFASYFREGEPIVSKSAQDISGLMPPAVFMEALPRLVRARAIGVTFWEHSASAPKVWRKVKSF